MSEHPAAELHSACLNCGSALTGHFCAQCGQNNHDHAPTLAHALHELVHEVLHVDGKIFRSVRALLFSPGLLTHEYWAGRIASWVRPLRIFLIAAALHLVFATHAVGPMNFRAIVTLEANGERKLMIGQDPENTLPKGRTLAPADEQRAFNEKLRKSHTSFRYLSVVLFSLLSWAVFRKRQPYLAMHLVFGLHFFAFWYLLSIVGDQGLALSKWALPIGLLYLLLMVRRAYGMHWFRAVLGTLFLWFCLIAIEGGLIFFFAARIAAR